MCGLLKPTRPGPTPAPGRLRCGYHSGKGRTVEAVAKKPCLFSEGNPSDGCSHKGERKKKDKNIQKVGSIIGSASQPSYMCEHSPAENSGSHLVPPVKPNTFPPRSSLPLCPLIHKVAEAHLTSLFNNTVHWIVTLDYAKSHLDFWHLQGKYSGLLEPKNDAGPVLIQGVTAGGRERHPTRIWLSGRPGKKKRASQNISLLSSSKILNYSSAGFNLLSRNPFFGINMLFRWFIWGLTCSFFLIFLGYTWKKNKNLFCLLHFGNNKHGTSVIDIYVAVPGLPLREEVETGPVIQTYSL